MPFILIIGRHSFSSSKVISKEGSIQSPQLLPCVAATAFFDASRCLDTFRNDSECLDDLWGLFSRKLGCCNIGTHGPILGLDTND
jgi:hypothetical protein